MPRINLNNLKLTRRTFVQMTSALSATAMLYGCGGGSSPKDYDSALDNTDDYVMDKSVTVVKGSHGYGCGGHCVWNHHVKGYGTKNARPIKCTSVGDIPRDGSLEADEDLAMVQFRGCVRGYTQLKRTFSPERLKYPLIQTKERGDVTGFKRVSWDEALDKVADMVAEVYGRYSSGELPYIPLLAGHGNPLQQTVNLTTGGYGSAAGGGCGSEMVRYLGPTFHGAGAPSTDNLFFAGVGACGPYAASGGSNSVMNYLKTDFLLQWGCDHNHKYPNQTFFLTKAKEAGIPIVTIDPKFTDNAAIQSSGYADYDLPAHIRINPGTDSALTVAMAYYIYKNQLHKDAFIRSECYGFYPTLADFTDSDGIVNAKMDAPAFSGAILPPNPFFISRYGSQLTGGYYLNGNHNGMNNLFSAGDPMHVPAGESFVEYLDSFGIEKYEEVHGSGSAASASKQDKINAVSDWASELTGIDNGTIINLASAIAKTGNVFLENGNNGGQKTNNGMYHVWLLIGLVAMCGHSFSDGGNLGVEASNSRSSISYSSSVGSFPALHTGGNTTQGPNMLIDVHRFAQIVFTGKEGTRSDEQFYNDFKYTYGVELDPTDPKIEIDMVFGGLHVANSINTSPNTNMHIKAFTAKNSSGEYKVKHYVVYEQMMTPTALFADVVLPACSQHEISYFGGWFSESYNNKLMEPMYDSKPDIEIDILLAEKLRQKGIAIEYSKNGKTDDELNGEVWEAATWLGDGDKPSFEEMKANGNLQRSISASIATNTSRLMMSYAPTETGKLQFFSNYYNYRDGGTAPNTLGKYRSFPAPRYVEPYQGKDKILRGENVGVKGLTYSLQFTTKRARNKSHSIYDNVAMIKDYYDYGKRASMSSVDAAKRGIKDGDMVYIYNDLGCMYVGVEVNERMTEGVIDLGHSTWYRAGSDTYDAWFDVDMGDSIGSKTVKAKVINEMGQEVEQDVTYYKYKVPMDIGGCENILVHNMSQCGKDPWIGYIGNNHYNGNWCEVSKTHPDSL